MINLIVWKDHASFEDQNWKTKDELDLIENCLTCTTVGFVERENDDVVILSFTTTENEKFSGCMAILKSTIISRKILDERRYKT